MAEQYIDIPLHTTIREIEKKNFSLSATQYRSFCIKNKNMKDVKDFLSRNLKRSDLGSEVGSENYVPGAPCCFIKTKALQKESYLLDRSSDSIVEINPKSFVNINLKKGDILISKDSNVGEAAILDEDYDNAMLCGGIYRLPIKENKYYLLSFIKHDVFRQQIDFIVPKGSTIRHGKTKFLCCKIPLPNKNTEETIRYVEALMKAIIDKETEVRKKTKQVATIVDNELSNNICTKKEYAYRFPNILEILSNGRMDTKTYTPKFKYLDYKIKHYKYGVTYITADKISGGNTPTRRVISMGSDLQYYWVTPSIFSNEGLLNSNQTINCNKNNINKNCLLIVNRTSKGEDGVYVGLSYFYDYNLLGKGQHNQGIYRVEKYDDNFLIFINAIINSPDFRFYCGALSMGSKMKEIKLKEIQRIPIPKFSHDKQNEIVKLYHNENCHYNPEGVDASSFLEYDKKFNETAGVYEIERSRIKLQEILKKAIDCITNDIEVNCKIFC